MATPMATQRITEISFELPAEEVSVLDGYCQSTGKKRTAVFRKILREWSAQKHREAVSICRVAGSNPEPSGAHRDGADE